MPRGRRHRAFHAGRRPQPGRRRRGRRGRRGQRRRGRPPRQPIVVLSVLRAAPLLLKEVEEEQEAKVQISPPPGMYRDALEGGPQVV